MPEGFIEFADFTTIREALYHPDLSRTFDKRSWDEGNHRAGILSIAHGEEHKLRRRLENPLFRRDNLVRYERELFADVMERVLARVVGGGEAVDLFRLGGMLSVVLACKRAGIDHDESLEQIRRLVGYVETFSQGTAILDIVGDAEAIRAEVRSALAEFEEAFFAASRTRREALLEAAAAGQGGQDPPDDVLTRLLEARDDPRFGFDAGQILRETATYVQAGTHTSAQTLVNAIDCMLGESEGDELLARAAADEAFAQRVVHETVRLRPTTPRIKRLAEADLEIDGTAIAAGSTVVLDIRTANRDPALFGEDAAWFNPGRQPPRGVPLWGLSFGAGAHICIGRSVAGGFPIDGSGRDSGDRLVGLVALMVQRVAALRPTQVAGDPPEIDGRTDRGTRWARYPVVFRDLDQLPADDLEKGAV